jgi:predicted esterase
MAKLRFLVVAFLVFGCLKKEEGTGFTTDGGTPPGVDSGPVGAGVGGPCMADLDCRTGLACATTHTCQPPGNKVPDSSCTLSAECLPGNYCAMGKCKPSGMTAEGGACTMEGDCASGLVCNLNGLAGTCAKPGLGDLGAACVATSGCRAGLVCASGKCQTMTMVMPPPAMGMCPEAAEQPTARVVFHVPRAGETSQDFYRLPFPNDIRIKGGKVDMTGHPVPGPGLLGFDLVDRYLRAIEAESTGFSVNPSVFFRFSRNPKFDTVKLPDSVIAYNITPGSPQYGQVIHPGWYTSTGGGKYICPRWIVVRHGFGAPLRQGETYAYVLGKTITDSAGAPMDQDDDFKAMLAATAPADAALGDAWKAYAPLRAFIAAGKIDGASIGGAAVFTTDKVETPLVKLREAVRAAAAPMVKGFFHCGDAGKSPCDDGKTGAAHQRGCLAANPAFDEYQGTVGIPVFQKGTPPYDQPADGGGIEFDSLGNAKIQRTEDVCVVLTVPKGTAPASGWPLVVYSHGTGGSYRSVVDQGLSADYAVGAIDGGAVPMATLGYDGVLHGPRMGATTKDVDQLVYNFQNPPAARDNAVQAAVDLFAIARAVESWSTGGIKLDPAKVALYGHSQGGNAAANAISFEPRYGAVVLSGTGGTLLLSLLHKKQPVDISSLIPFVLGELTVDENHPVLNLLQMYLDRSDSVNYGRRIFADPLMGVPPRQALMIYGTGDTYAPNETQRTFANAAGFDIVGPVLDAEDMKDITDMHKLPAIMAPAKGNFAVMGGAVTAVEAQYKPGNYDGHFVSTNNAAARKAIQGMLGTFMRDGVPTVSP